MEISKSLSRVYRSRNGARVFDKATKAIEYALGMRKNGYEFLITITVDVFRKR